MSAEPYCNHDTAAVHDGICECGEIVGPCTLCGSLHAGRTFTEINLEAVCDDCAEELKAAGDGIALDLIAAQLAGYLRDTSDSTDRLDAIAAVIRGTGRTVSEQGEPDDITCASADQD